ncbi:MAG: hypothetical protein H6573_23495 [Lewinellaceae bacterium]|nr:hypothetical protein [Phaeodactylibacter sp.]MCB9350454.1 hypothetical protein [Lewinellaceae bacterium]
MAYGIEPAPGHWLLQRFVSIGYYALVDYTKVKPSPDVFSVSCDWHPLEELPELIRDHRNIIHHALGSLRLMLDHKLSGFNLLPETFTMADLQGRLRSRPRQKAATHQLPTQDAQPWHPGTPG